MNCEKILIHTARLVPATYWLEVVRAPENYIRLAIITSGPEPDNVEVKEEYQLKTGRSIQCVCNQLFSAIIRCEVAVQQLRRDAAT